MLIADVNRHNIFAARFICCAAFCHFGVDWEAIYFCGNLYHCLLLICTLYIFCELCCGADADQHLTDVNIFATVEG